MRLLFLICFSVLFLSSSAQETFNKNIIKKKKELTIINGENVGKVIMGKNYPVLREDTFKVNQNEKIVCFETHGQKGKEKYYEKLGLNKSEIEKYWFNNYLNINDLYLSVGAIDRDGKVVLQPYYTLCRHYNGTDIYVFDQALWRSDNHPVVYNSKTKTLTNINKGVYTLLTPSLLETYTRVSDKSIYTIDNKLILFEIKESTILGAGEYYEYKNGFKKTINPRPNFLNTDIHDLKEANNAHKYIDSVDYQRPVCKNILIKANKLEKLLTIGQAIDHFYLLKENGEFVTPSTFKYIDLFKYKDDFYVATITEDNKYQFYTTDGKLILNPENKQFMEITVPHLDATLADLNKKTIALYAEVKKKKTEDSINLAKTRRIDAEDRAYYSMVSQVDNSLTPGFGQLSITIKRNYRFKDIMPDYLKKNADNLKDRASKTQSNTERDELWNSVNAIYDKWELQMLKDIQIIDANGKIVFCQPEIIRNYETNKTPSIAYRIGGDCGCNIQRIKSDQLKNAMIDVYIYTLPYGKYKVYFSQTNYTTTQEVYNSLSTSFTLSSDNRCFILK